MFVKVSSLLALVAYVAAQAADPSINTPAAVVQCQPAQISFTATRTPVFVSIIPGGQAGATPLADLGQQTSSPITWTANIASGTSITFQIRDSTGAVAYSAPITIQASSDSSCLGAQAPTSAAGSSAPATSAVATTSNAVTSAVASASSAVSSVASSVSSAVASASTATAPATTARPTSSAASVISSASSRASGASSAAASPSSTPNGAMPTAKVGIAGLLGLAAAVVMA